MKELLIVVCLVLMPFSVFAQEEDPPPILWVQYFQAQQYPRERCSFQDVFAVDGGGYVCCGGVNAGNVNSQAWLLELNEVGARINELTFPYEENNNAWTDGYSVIKTDDGGLLMGGRTQIGSVTQMNFDVMKVNPEGEQEWWNVFFNGRSSAFCWALIELKEGNYVASGQTDGHNACAVMFNDEGDVMWSNEYEGYYLTAIREVADDGLVFAGYSQDGAIFLKTDYEGDVIWRTAVQGGVFWNMISLTSGGFAACGGASHREGFFLVRIDDEGNERWSHNYELLGGYSLAYGLGEMPDGGMVLSGNAVGDEGDVSAVIRVDGAGNLLWQRFDDQLPDNGVVTDYYQSIVMPDGSIVICGKSGRRSLDNVYYREGVLVCLGPDRTPPYIVEYSPEELELEVLRGDSLLFWVQAEDLTDDVLSYFWLVNEDTIATDSSVVIHFDELGEQTIRCHVWDGHAADSIRWRVDVEELYIDSYLPESLHMTVRRNTTVDFSVTSRAVEGDPVEYEWVLDNEIIADGDSLSILFDRGRNHEVEAVAYRGHISDEVIWQIEIQDLIVDYWPRRFDLDVPIDTVMEFTVEPFDPEDESLDILWTLDGHLVGDRSWTFIEFNSAGQYQVKGIVSDSSVTDSLSWDVRVSRNAIGQSDQSLLPDIPTLYPPSPNPFNSQTTVRYFLPTADNVRLELFDMNGRLVTLLAHQRQTFGMHSSVIDGSDLVSGVYFVRMRVAEEVHSRKVLLMK